MCSLIESKGRKCWSLPASPDSAEWTANRSSEGSTGPMFVNVTRALSSTIRTCTAMTARLVRRVLRNAEYAAIDATTAAAADTSAAIPGMTAGAMLSSSSMRPSVSGASS